MRHREREELALTAFCRQGRCDVSLGGQFGSEGKGAAVAWLADRLKQEGRRYDVVTTNASSQAGHTAVHEGRTYVTRHLPTAPLINAGSWAFLNAGCAIDPDVLEQELKDYDYLNQVRAFTIHPNAAVITPDCIKAESRPDSPQTKIASTRKGVGEAIARKVLRSGMIAGEHPFLKQFTMPLDLNLQLAFSASVLAEVPQGYGLSLNGPFYPTCTSRDCTVMQGLSDAHVHPRFVGAIMLVMRTFPIRVGNIGAYSSGIGYPDQRETTWEALGLKPEITTVTKRERRVFTWSHDQLEAAVIASRPQLVFLSHCDQLAQPEFVAPIVKDILDTANGRYHLDVEIAMGGGPSTADVVVYDRPRAGR